VSYHTLIGIYAGFFANWIALIIGYVSIGFLFRFLNRSRKLDIAVFFVAMIALMLAHTYTWTVFVIIIPIFLLIMLRMKLYPRRSIFLLLAVVLSSVAVDVSKSALVDTNLAIQNDIRFIFEFGMGPGDYEGRLDVITFTIQQYLGGLFANFIILMLGIYWLVRCNHKHPSNILLFLSFSTGIIPLFIGDWLFLARLLYIIPFQLPAAIALATILHSGQVERKKISLQTNQLQKPRQLEMYEEGLPTPLISNKVIILVVFIWLISMSIKALTNLPPYA
ncbi:MAG TPA: hypothetical protein VE130_08915, partial [Nitrososphaeraceae archaeon]|nr:hypothetical protein [Nitrososphaeraceae archaeon]